MAAPKVVRGLPISAALIALLLATLGVGNSLGAAAPQPFVAPDVVNTIGANSCIGENACAGVSGNVGDNSCNGFRACTATRDSVGDNSCNGYQAPCLGAAGSIGENSCNGFQTCYFVNASVGDDSCTGDNACFQAAGSIGSNSCNLSPIGSCYFATEPIGDCENNYEGYDPAVCLDDTAPPAIDAHEDVLAEAEGPAGANVAYTTPSAIDDIDGPVPVVCTPASGSLFALGDTTIECTAEDAAGNDAQSYFTVHVAGATEQLATLTTFVTGIGPGGSLQAKATAVQAYLDAGDTASACSKLKALANEAKAQSGKTLTTAQANSIITSASRIRAVLAC